MISRRSLKRIGYGLAALLVSIGLLAGIALLPGSIDGIYREMAPECGCDSVNFLCCVDGRLVGYQSGHPPADFVGRYDVERDGVCSLYLFSAWKGKEDELWCRAYPHFLVTRFEPVNGGTSHWYWKRPRMGVIGKTLKTHEIVRQIIVGKGRLATTRFDSGFRKIGEEIVTGKDAKTPESSAGTDTAIPGAPAK